ncbi:hypothetical protein ACOSQ2_002133 [Xanthoceras sorbifolium]
MLPFRIFVSSDVSLVDEVENEENTVHASAGFCDPDGDDMEKAVKQYAIQEGFMLTKIKNDRSRYTVKCKNETCDWRFHASCLPDRLTFMIHSVQGGHSFCLRTTSNKEANSNWVLEVVGTAIMANLTILPKVLKTELQEKYAIKCGSQTIYRAKKRVLKNLKVDHVNLYAKIRQYANTKRPSINLGTDMPRAGSRYCFRHIVANFRATLKNLNMTEKLWATSRVGYATGFKEVMKSIKDDSVKAYDYLMKSDHNTNNMSECFNSWIKDDREKPILTLMESLRRKFMVRFHEKWEEVKKFEDGISPYARGRINDNDKEGRKLHVFHGRGEYHETIDTFNKKMLVNLKEKTCNCRLWEISGIPCEHALAAFSFNRQFTHESVHWYYSNEALKLTYGGNINPVPEEALWYTFIENENIEPPILSPSKLFENFCQSFLCFSGYPKLKYDNNKHFKILFLNHMRTLPNSATFPSIFNKTIHIVYLQTLLNINYYTNIYKTHILSLYKLLGYPSNITPNLG